MLDKNSYNILIAVLIAYTVYVIIQSQNQEENFDVFPEYSYPGSYPQVYHNFQNDFESMSGKCIVDKDLDVDCFNRALLRTGGDRKLSMALCGGKPVDLSLYKYRDYINDFNQSDYVYISPQVFATKSQVLPTYEHASRRHF